MADSNATDNRTKEVTDKDRGNAVTLKPINCVHQTKRAGHSSAARSAYGRRGKARKQTGQRARSARHTRTSRGTALTRGHDRTAHPPLGQALMRNGQSTTDRHTPTGQSALAEPPVDSVCDIFSTAWTDDSGDSGNVTKSVSDLCMYGVAEAKKPYNRARVCDGAMADANADVRCRPQRRERRQGLPNHVQLDR